MRELSSRDLKVIENFISTYVEVLKEILIALDVKDKAQYQAWHDWAIDTLIEKGKLSEDVAKKWVIKLEIYYKEKTYDTN